MCGILSFALEFREDQARRRAADKHQIRKALAAAERIARVKNLPTRHPRQLLNLSLEALFGLDNFHRGIAHLLGFRCQGKTAKSPPSAMARSSLQVESSLLPSTK